MDFCDSDNRNHIVETEKQLLETGLSTEFEEDLNIAISENNGENDEEPNIDDEDSEENIDSSEEQNIDDEDFEENIDDSNEDFEQNTDDNEDSKQDMENESILSAKDSELSDNENMSSEKTNRVNVKSKSYSRNDEDEINDEGEENEELRHSDASEQSDDNKGLWEDIYGRQRDKEGNVIAKKYVPPAARVTNTDTSVDNEKTRRLERQLKGILNRLAEQNMHAIANQVILLYQYA